MNPARSDVPHEELPATTKPNTDSVFFAIWRERMRHVVKNLKEQRLSSRLDTSDLVQEGMLYVWHNIDSFRGTTEQEFNVWIKRIASGHTANASRYHHAHKRNIDSEAGELPNLAHHEQPAIEAEHNETLTRLAAAVEVLEPSKKFVVLQYVFEQRTFADISSDLKCSAGTVRNIYNNALKQLRRRLLEEN